MGSCVIQLNIFRNMTQRENYIQKAAKTFILTAFFSRKRDSNTRPADYESAALPTELFQQLFRFTQLHNGLNIAYFLMTVKHLFLSPRFTRFADNSLYFCSLPCRFSVQRCIPHPHIFQNPSKKHPVFFRWPSTIL